MVRDFHASAFCRDDGQSEDADPRVGLVNLADVMLVFACGLMLALVAYWNLDISAMQEVVQAGDVTEITDIDKLANAQLGGSGGYTELGTVYKDPMTGKLYMLTEELAADGSAASGASSSVQDATDAQTQSSSQSAANEQNDLSAPRAPSE